MFQTQSKTKRDQSEKALRLDTGRGKIKDRVEYTINKMYTSPGTDATSH